LPKTGGRKPGSCNLRTRAIADKAAAEGLTPLEMMLLDMKQKFRAGDLAAAADRARDCAPYMHAKLATTTISATVKREVVDLSDAELTAIAQGAALH
jgi:hypothetical protein